MGLGIAGRGAQAFIDAFGRENADRRAVDQRVVGEVDLESREVEEVIRMQVRDEDDVDVRRVDDLVKVREGTIAAIDEDAKRLTAFTGHGHEVARGRLARTLIAAGAAHHCQFDAHAPSSRAGMEVVWVIAGPRKRCERRAKLLVRPTRGAVSAKMWLGAVAAVRMRFSP